MIDMPEQEDEQKTRVQFFETMLAYKQTKYGFIVYTPGKKTYTSQLYDTRGEMLAEARKIK